MSELITTPVRRWLGGPRPPHPARTVASVAPGGVPGLRAGMSRILREVFGTRNRDELDDVRVDEGLCGPGSPSWRVIAEPAAIVGGVRALVMQTMHPLAMAGVAEHSSYRDDPLGRLHRTALYVTTTTFGTTDEVLRVSRMVRRVHVPVRGIAPDGRPYRASDPRLLVWVSVALTTSFLTADRLWSPHPAHGADADGFIEEQSRIAALLDPRVDLAVFEHDESARRDLRDGRVDLPLLADLPQTVDELTDVLESFEPDLQVGAQAREAMRWLRWPPLAPPLRAAYVVLFAGAAGSLHPEDRERLGLPTSRVAGYAAIAQTAAAVDLLRGVAGRSPAYRVAAERLEDRMSTAAAA